MPHAAHAPAWVSTTDAGHSSARLASPLAAALACAFAADDERGRIVVLGIARRRQARPNDAALRRAYNEALPHCTIGRIPPAQFSTAHRRRAGPMGASKMSPPVNNSGLALCSATSLRQPRGCIRFHAYDRPLLLSHLNCAPRSISRRWCAMPVGHGVQNRGWQRYASERRAAVCAPTYRRPAPGHRDCACHALGSIAMSGIVAVRLYGGFLCD